MKKQNITGENNNKFGLFEEEALNLNQLMEIRGGEGNTTTTTTTTTTKDDPEKENNYDWQ